MASPNGDTCEFLKRLLSSLLWKEEIFQIGLYKASENIEKHLFSVFQKIEELKIGENEQADFIKKTLHQDVLYELSSLADYQNKKNDAKWINEKLIELFGKKESKVSSYSNCLKVKQLPGQSTRSFLSTVRVHCQKLFYNQTTEERETWLLKSFINGLMNAEARKVLDELKPRTLEEAFSLIKDEKFENGFQEECIFAINKESQTCSCSRRIENLLHRIKELELKVNSQTTRQYQHREQKNVSQVTKCFNCNMPGHIARYCRKKPTCRNCGIAGHIAENCRRWSKPVEPKFRRMFRSNESCVSEPATDIIESNLGKFDDEPVEAVVQKENHTKEPNALYTIQQEKKKKVYPKNICAWAQYINGEGKMPKRSYARTVISSSRSEIARHKPVIQVKICDKYKNVLLDTGCDTNVIDYSFLKSLTGGKIYYKSGTLKCANGSLINIMGYTILPLTIDSKTVRTKMTVVNEMFPNVILGMKAMHTLNLSVHPSKECAELHTLNGTRVEIPFISQTNKQEEN